MAEKKLTTEQIETYRQKLILEEKTRQPRRNICVPAKNNFLPSGRTKSCGCLQKKQIVDNLRLVDGTSVTILETMKGRLLSGNTSGYNGVYWNKRKPAKARRQCMMIS